jgi:hypothetical protein
MIVPLVVCLWCKCAVPPDDPNFSEKKFLALRLEHFRKYCSHAVGKDEGAVFLGFGFVSAQSQAAAGMLPHSASPKHQKILAPHGYSIFSNALEERFHGFSVSSS